MTRHVVRDLVAAGTLLVEDGNHGNDRPRPDEFVDMGVAYIRAADMTSGVVDFRGAGKISNAARRRIRKGVGEPSDVILSHKGTVGRVAVAPMDSPEYVCSPQTTFWRSTNRRILSQRYLAYVLKSPDFQRQLKMLAGQTDMAPYASLTDQRSMSIEVPSIGHQNAVAELLGALDDKIAANDEVLRLTDELVRIKFEKVGGGEISLSEVAINVREQVDPGEVPPTTPYIGLEHMPRRRMWLDKYSESSEAKSSKSVFRTGDVLFGKLRPYFHKVVSAAFDGITSTDVLVIRAKREELAGFVLAAASSDRVIRGATAASEGTRMPRTNWATVGATQIQWGGDAAAEALSSEVLDLARLTDRLVRESAALGWMRDELLPLLMSGKIRVRDAERQAEDVL